MTETSEKKNNKVKFKENFEPEIDNINIFRHHPHIGKSIKDSSIESGVEYGGIKNRQQCCVRC